MATQGRQEPKRGLERQRPRLCQKAGDEPEAACTTPQDRKGRGASEVFLRKNEWNARPNERRKRKANAKSVVIKSMELLKKACTRCKTEKPLDAVNFPLHNKTKSGFDSWCRACRKEYRNANSRGAYRNSISDEALKDLKDSTKACVICGDETKLVVDHDHVTGSVRGMLCNHCNRGLGHFRDDPTLLEFAAQYLYASANHPNWDAYRSNSKPTGVELLK